MHPYKTVLGIFIVCIAVYRLDFCAYTTYSHICILRVCSLLRRPICLQALEKKGSDLKGFSTTIHTEHCAGLQEENHKVVTNRSRC